MDKSGKAFLQGSNGMELEVETEDCLQEAANVCPMEIIKIEK